MIALQDQPLKEWIPHRDEYLAEMIRLEGRGDAELESCPRCPPGASSVPCYRCKDCFGMQLLCGTCCVEVHGNNPLHVIEVRAMAFSVVYVSA